MARGRLIRYVRERRWAQWACLVIVLLIGAQFAVWALAHLAGLPPALPRPAGVEGFLPISALMSLRLWVSGGGIHPVHPAGLAILLAILAMSALVAKSFCSLVCPVGTVSETLGKLGDRLLGATWRPPHWLDVPLRSLKYLLLAFFLWAVLVSLDLPGVRAFLDSPYNKVADVKMLLFFLSPSDLTIAVIGMLGVGSILVRDLWCRFLCPYGALLGLLGRLAPLKVTRDPSRCTDCQACTRACPARLQVHRMIRVASVECTTCQDCVAACPVRDCLAVRSPWLGRPGTSLNPGRAVVVAMAVFLGMIAAFRIAGQWRGSVSEAEFAARLAEIHSPLYTHTGGLAASNPEAPAIAPVPAHRTGDPSWPSHPGGEITVRGVPARQARADAGIGGPSPRRARNLAQ